MAYELTDINYRTVSDPKGFCEECEEKYERKVKQAAKRISENLKESPIVLLSGPSGSGKTTTAHKISDELKNIGIDTHYVSMDDYFKNVDETTPRTQEGGYDLESPLCLDMELLNRHFAELARGERIYVPKYNFASQVREEEPAKSICLGKDEICIFEGIHALNDSVTAQQEKAFRLYISARSDVRFGETVVFKSTWFRLVRRTVRDFNFRGADPEETMRMWANVRRGEKLYISPFKNKANYQFDTSFACELAVMNSTVTKLFQTVPEGIERFEELRSVLPAIQLFGVIGEECVPGDSLLREFIGGANP